MTPRQRLLTALDGGEVDRPPVICPGGMMTLASTEVMARTGFTWPGAHQDARQTAGLVRAVHEATGIGNVGVPFCMTVEAEALGSRIHLGSETVQPRVAQDPLAQGVGILEPACGIVPTTPLTVAP